jgi:hypothetical protein
MTNHQYMILSQAEIIMMLPIKVHRAIVSRENLREISAADSNLTTKSRRIPLMNKNCLLYGGDPSQRRDDLTSQFRSLALQKGCEWTAAREKEKKKVD